MNFDPETDEPDDSSSRQKNVKKMYDKLVARGDEETAEKLRGAGALDEQARYIGQHVVDFDPEHDEDVNTSSKLAIQNVYDALRELGHDELAEELRGFKSLSSQNRRAIQLTDEVEAEIDPVTGTFEAPRESGQESGEVSG